MMTNPSDQYTAVPLEVDSFSVHIPGVSSICDQDNMFDWHFTLRGTRDTEFEGGVYHGRILLPADYPFRPPNIILLTVRRCWILNSFVLMSSTHCPITYSLMVVLKWKRRFVWAYRRIIPRNGNQHGEVRKSRKVHRCRLLSILCISAFDSRGVDQLYAYTRGRSYWSTQLFSRGETSISN